MLHQQIFGLKRYTDSYALRFNGTDESASLANPSWHRASTGTILIRVSLPAVLGANGAIPILSLADTGAGRNRQFYLSARRQSNFGDTATRFDLLVQDDGSALKGSANVVGTVADPTALSASTWYTVAFDSNGKIWVNGSNGTPMYWRESPLYWGTGSRTGWFSFLTGSSTADHTLYLARNASGSTYGPCDLNNLTYINRVLTGAEHSEAHSAMVAKKGMQYCSFGADVVNLWPFERTLKDIKAGEDLTGVNITGSNYVTP